MLKKGRLEVGSCDLTKKKVRRIELKNALIHLDGGHSYSQFYSATQKLLYLKLQLENKILETK